MRTGADRWVDAPIMRLVALGVALIVGALFGFAWLRSSKTRRARRRARRAAQGERDAERLLELEGFVIVGRQVERVLRVEVDGFPTEAGLRCDFVVRRGGALYVAEVKTGAVAPRIDHAPTRRQLLEYRLAFDVEGVLLVDPEAGRIRDVVFPALAARSSSRARALVAYALAALFGAAVAAFFGSLS